MKKIKTKSIVLISLVLAVAGIALLLETTGVINFYGDDSSPGSADETDRFINYDPPNEEDKNSGNIKKEELVNEEERLGQPDNINGKKTVKPIITSAGHYENQIEVRGFIPGIFESNGMCIATFMKGSTSITREVEGIKDATTTRCDTVMILRSDFPEAGSWTVTLRYSSPSAEGESDVSSFEVQ